VLDLRGIRQDARMNHGFTLERDESGRLDFHLRSAWSPAMRGAFYASDADGLIANYARGFSGHDLEFVRELPLRRLHVLARSIRDLSPVYDLAGTLEEFRVQSAPMTPVDRAALPKLRALACTWPQVVDTIEETTTLEYLAAGEYSAMDLTPLAHLTSLRGLLLKDRPSLRSLDGVESMPWVASLGIFLAPLEDTTALSRLKSPVLTELRLGACRRINSLNDMSSLVGLRFLDVSEGGDIDSLRPISDLKRLERLYLYDTTRIVDGDLTPLLGLPRLADLRMMNRRHYKPSMPEVKRHLGVQ
jgi:hypothetical protein